MTVPRTNEHNLTSVVTLNTRWFKYDRDYLCVNKPQSVPVIFEPPCKCTQQQQTCHISSSMAAYKNQRIISCHSNNADWLYPNELNQWKHTHTHTCTYIYIYIYTECPRRNVPDFGRVFLTLKYTDITQNTYIQSWTVTEIIAREKCGLLAVPRNAPFQLMRYVYTAHVLETGMQSTLFLRAQVKCLEP